MKTPSQVTGAELELSIQSYFAERCYRSPDGWRCLECKREIAYVIAYMTIHDIRFGSKCAGNGRVERAPIPYCPHCESKPSDYGCVHEEQVSIFERVDLAGRIQ
jgi:hypothetical protein